MKSKKYRESSRRIDNEFEAVGNPNSVDYDDTFSPVARYDSARLLLVITMTKNFELKQFDVSTTFLSGNIDETTYMEHSEGYVDREHPEYVC